jgi:ribonuclease P protein component
MPDAPLQIERLKKRPDFLACAQGPSCAKGAIVIQARPRADENQLVRSRLHRHPQDRQRRRAQPRQAPDARGRPFFLPDLAQAGFDYVFIARNGMTTRPWDRLLDDVKSALISLAAERDGPATHPVTGFRATPPLRRTARPKMQQDNSRNTIIFLVCAVAIFFAYQFFVLEPAVQAAPRRTGAQKPDRRSARPPRPRRPPRHGSIVPAKSPARRPAPPARACRSPPLVLSARLVCAARRIDDLFLKQYRETIDQELAARRAAASRGRRRTPGSPIRLDRRQRARPAGAETVWKWPRARPCRPASPVTLTYANGQGLPSPARSSVDDKFMFTVTDSVANTGRGGRHPGPLRLRPAPGHPRRPGQEPHRP